jgi:DNA (cytosine-5)-methyltransferase 1
LAELGFDAEWDVFSAAGVGAPHRRRRLFVVARRVSDPLGLCLRNESERGQGGSQAAECRDTEYVHLGETVGDSDCGGLEGERIAQHSGQGTLGDEPERSDYDGQLLWPPGPSDSEGWRSYIADGGAEPSIRRGSDGNAARMERLHALGNAVVPLVAAHAFQTLWTRF